MPAITIADLNNAKLDVDHIAEIATSTDPTSTDRLGNTKPTLAGKFDTIDDQVAVKLDEIDATLADEIAGVTAARNDAEGFAATASSGAASAAAVAAALPTNLGRIFSTYAELAAVSGLSTGTPGEVTADAGTHTDPVVGGTVSNTGRFEYVSATGWKRVGDNDVTALKAAVAAMADEVTAPADGNTYLAITADGETVLAIDNDTETLFGSAIDNLGIRPYEVWREWPLRLATAPTKYIAGEGWNHLLIGGQSNALGSSDSAPPVSTVQPYSNLTFDGGVRADGTTYSWAATKALVEDQQGINSESSCSGATEIGNAYAARKHGVHTGSFIQFASVAGAGATALSGLDKPSASYTRMLDHSTQAKALATAAGKSYNLQAIGWQQGETDVTGGVTRATHVSQLNTFISDFNADLKAIKVPQDPVHLLIAQCSYGATTAVASNIALAQLDVALSNPLAHIYGPTYMLPFDEDDTHRSSLGHKIEGAYLGRAWAQLLLEGRKPDCLMPLGGFASGTTLRIRFRVPTYPLRLNITDLVKADDYGIKVVDDTGTLTLSAFTIENGDTVRLTLNRTLGANPRLRLGLDYLPWNLSSSYSGITNGAVTNISDSTSDTITITYNGDTVTYPLPHWCLHYEGAISNLVS